MKLFELAYLNKIVPVYFLGAFQFTSHLKSVRLYQSTGGFHIFVVAAEIIYLLFILYYMFLQVNTDYYYYYFRSMSCQL